MSTTSTIPSSWADKPWPILPSPQGQGHDPASHFSVHMATDMCHVHNLIIRGLNSIYLQSPFVYKDQDVQDLFIYTKALIQCINAHHDGEEKYLFPGLVTYTGNPDIMSENQDQHAAFHKGLNIFEQYCTSTPTAEFSHLAFQDIICSFAPALYQHLSDEIPTILSLRDIPSDVLKPLWRRAERHINEVGSMDEMFPLAFGCIDRGYEAGKHRFPPVPLVVNLVVKYWFARKHSSAWRFNPCDMWGKPRPLHFLPADPLR